MKVLVTGSSKGIGKAGVQLFLEKGHEVIGIDKEEASICSQNYKHFIADISEKNSLPEISDLEILINNAWIQTGNEEDI